MKSAEHVTSILGKLAGNKGHRSPWIGYELKNLHSGIILERKFNLHLSPLWCHKGHNLLLHLWPLCSCCPASWGRLMFGTIQNVQIRQNILKLYQKAANTGLIRQLEVASDTDLQKIWFRVGPNTRENICDKWGCTHRSLIDPVLSGSRSHTSPQLWLRARTSPHPLPRQLALCNQCYVTLVVHLKKKRWKKRRGSRWVLFNQRSLFICSRHVHRHSLRLLVSAAINNAHTHTHRLQERKHSIQVRQRRKNQVYLQVIYSGGDPMLVQLGLTCLNPGIGHRPPGLWRQPGPQGLWKVKQKPH